MLPLNLIALPDGEGKVEASQSDANKKCQPRPAARVCLLPLEGARDTTPSFL